MEKTVQVVVEHPVRMVQNGTGWDAHFDITTRDPYLRLGTLVINSLERPSDLAERFDNELARFLSNLEPIAEPGN